MRLFSCRLDNLSFRFLSFLALSRFDSHFMLSFLLNLFLDRLLFLNLNFFFRLDLELSGVTDLLLVRTETSLLVTELTTIA